MSSIQDNSSKETLNALLVEYELAFNAMSKADDRILQIATISLGTLGALTGYIFNIPVLSQATPGQSTQLTIEVLWLLPFVFIVFLGINIFVYFFGSAALWNCRVLTHKINHILEDRPLLLTEPNTPSSRILSSQHGDLKFRLLYTIILGGIFAVFFAVLIYSFNRIYPSNHLAGTSFLFLYTILLVINLLALKTLFVDMPSIYRDYIKQLTSSTKKTDPNHLYLNSSGLSKSLKSILPRPWDFLVKSVFVVYGFITGLVLIGIDSNRVALADKLFSTNQSWLTSSSIPSWALLLLGVVFVFTSEGLLQQAKLLWDDVRDIDRDKTILHNRERALASQSMSVRHALIQMSVRWVLAFVVGYFIGGIELLMVFALVSLHQIIYVLWAKPRGNKNPVIVLFLLSFNVPLRFLVGVVSISGPSWSYAPIVLLTILFYFYSMGSLAAQWKMEAQYQKENNLQISIRPQSHFYLEKGEWWQHFGFVSAVLLSVLVLTLQIGFRFCNYQLPFQAHQLYGLCNSQLIYYNLPDFIATTIILGTAISLLVSLILVPTHAFKKYFWRIVAKNKGLIGNFASLGFVSSLVAAAAWGNSEVLMLGFFLLCTSILFTFQDMSYEEFSLMKLKLQLRSLAIAWGAYILKANSGLTLRKLFNFGKD